MTDNHGVMSRGSHQGIAGSKKDDGGKKGCVSESLQKYAIAAAETAPSPGLADLRRQTLKAVDGKTTQMTET